MPLSSTMGWIIRAMPYQVEYFYSSTFGSLTGFLDPVDFASALDALDDLEGFCLSALAVPFFPSCFCCDCWLAGANLADGSSISL